MEKVDLVKKMALSSDFSEHNRIIEYFNQNLDRFINYFQAIKELLYKPATDDNYNQVFQNFIKLFDYIPLMATKLYQDKYIVRARPNYNCQVFSKLSEISHKSDPNEIYAGRFNAPGISIFYGALQADNQLDLSLTSCLESCKPLTSFSVEIQDMTIGLWRIKEVLPVVNLCFDEQHLYTNNILKVAADQYLHQLEINYSKKAFSFLYEFFNYFSCLSRTNMKNNECYYILSALFAAIRYYQQNIRNAPFAGIIYPSSATEGFGLNTGLIPLAVNNILELDKVGMYRFILDKQNSIYNARPCCDLVDVTNGEFQITNYTSIYPNL